MSAATDTIDHLFRYTQAHVWLSSLSNDKNSTGVLPAHHATREPAEVDQFVREWDKLKRGLFFCVSTIKPGLPRLKDNVVEIPALWADIDLKDVDDKFEDVVRKLKQLPAPPSRLHFSGNGVHAFWLLKEPATPADVERVESALKLLADLVGGDQKVTQVSALMRLPGTHNSKNGEWKLVETLDVNGYEYELDELEDMLADCSPIILRKVRPSQYVDTNPFEEYAKKLGFRMPVDVEKRLAGMMYMGGGDASVHTTQVSVTAALLETGGDYEEIVKMVLEATRVAAGEYGARWNWKREERNIRRMCDTWLKKHPRDDDGAKKPRMSVGGADVVNLAAKRKQKQQEKEEQQQQEGEPQGSLLGRTKKKSLHIMLAKTLMEHFKAIGYRVITISDKQVMLYENGMWREIPKSWLDVKIELCAQGLKQDTTNRLINETRNFILRDAEVAKFEDIPWDMHGKIATRSGLLDPLTLKIEQPKPEDYVTTRIEVGFDPEAQCPWFLRMLDDMFADRTDEDREATIAVIQETLGAALLENKDRSLRKAIIFVGPSWCGKSDLLNVMSGLVTNTPNATRLSMLGTNHGLMQFALNKPWVLHEAFDAGQWIFPGMAKAILTGDPVDINIKNGPMISKEITSPVFWASNYPPQFKEATKAIINRMTIVPCNIIFDEGRRIGAAAEAYAKNFTSPAAMVLANEKAGILNWALAGLTRLLDRGKFAPTQMMLEAAEAVRTESNIADGFVKECCSFGSDFMISVSDFCAAFAVWWQENKGEDRHVPSNDSIGRALAALGDPRVGVDSKALRDERRRYYAGLHLNQIGMGYWDGAANEDMARGKTARISSAPSEVNRMIPQKWSDLEIVKRLRRAFEGAADTHKTQDAGAAPHVSGVRKKPDTSPVF